jgi:hypothetical protein
VAHEDRRVEALIYEQKWPVVADMFHLLQVSPQRFQEVSQVHVITCDPHVEDTWTVTHGGHTGPFAT